jgi:formylglycine-generating enzyme required for sulfatase activity
MLGDIDVESPEPGKFAHPLSVEQGRWPADEAAGMLGQEPVMSTFWVAQEDQGASASPADGNEGAIDIDIDSPEPGKFAHPLSVEQGRWPADEVAGMLGQESATRTVRVAQEDQGASVSPADGDEAAADSPAHLPGKDSIALLNSSGFSFVAIPAGTFMMGSAESELGRNDDERQHEVTLTRGFCMQTTLVTQKQWKLVMGTEPSLFGIEGDDCPVEGVSWNEVQEFVRKLNSLGDASYRLPSEAEWEYACRAGTASAFASGEITVFSCGHDASLDAAGWYCGNSGWKVHPVAQKAPNAWGLYDMHGNVCEWCQDWYGNYPATPQIDPLGSAFGPGRVVRGGSWFSNSQNCRSACRSWWAPNSRIDFIGFRLVRDEN